ncbi:MAG: hypothetical protein WBH47_24380 [Streptosporangiaceae bacterium]
MTMPANEFETGFATPRDQGPGENESLIRNSERFNTQAESSIGMRSGALSQQPTSVLSQLSKSPVAMNLSAASQSSRLLPNGFVMANTAQGSSAQTAETANYLRMDGENSI